MHIKGKMMKRTIFITSLILLLFLMGLDSVEVVSKGENLILKALIVNPSKTQKKFFPFKIYLPQEVKPEDVLEKGDLKVAYDSQVGMYYVYKDFELKPEETIVQEILIKNVWNISIDEINSIRSEMGKIAKLMENSDFSERANFLRNSIESKLMLITERQAQPIATADRYISNYRDNLRTLDVVKADLAALKSLLSQLHQSISASSTWKLILGITGFLGLLGVVFFVMWSRQIKGSAEKEQKARKESILSGEKREAEVEKKLEIKDIEDRLKK